MSMTTEEIDARRLELSEAAAVRERPAEGLEDAVEFLGRNADAFVLHLDEGAGRRRGVRQRRRSRTRAGSTVP